ncbi:MAG: site-specific DNA-methyltransferase [Rhodopseudomonas palustris]|nr:site-specific DNA-methyltransferase [Rhodopseudomonas palustris]
MPTELGPPPAQETDFRPGGLATRSPAIGPITEPARPTCQRIAKDPQLTAAIEAQLPQIPTIARAAIAATRGPSTSCRRASVHLVVTSPPYWTLKDYNPGEGQMGEIEDYEAVPERTRSRFGAPASTRWCRAGG